MFTTRSPKTRAAARQATAAQPVGNAQPGRFVDLEFELPWLGPAPHWVGAVDSSRLRPSLAARGFVVLDAVIECTGEAGFLAGIATSLNLGMHAAGSWTALADALARMSDGLAVPIAVVVTDPRHALMSDAGAALRSLLRLSTIAVRLNERPGRDQIAIVLQLDGQPDADSAPSQASSASPNAPRLLYS